MGQLKKIYSAIVLQSRFSLFVSMAWIGDGQWKEVQLLPLLMYLDIVPLCFVVTTTVRVMPAVIVLSSRSWHFTARKQSLRRLCFYTCLSVILFTAGVPGPGGCAWSGGGSWSRGGAWSGWQGCLVQEGAWLGGAWFWGWLVETPLRQLLLWVVRIILECIIVADVLYFLN